MSARSVLAKASAAGVQIRAADGDLSIKGDRLAVQEILPEVKAYKPEILVLLAANDPVLPQELEGLIALVAMVHGFTGDQTREAKEIAAGDVAGALICFRALAKRAKMRLDVPTDDRVVCRDCGNLLRGHCQAAAKGLMADTGQRYSPDQDLPRNCEHYIKQTQKKQN